MHEKVQREKYRLYAGTVLRGGGALAFGLAALTSSPVSANPQGGTVSAGAVTIGGQGSPVVQVNQQSDRAVIDWKSFNIAAGERTQFQQPSASSAILNRIHDQNPSQILGSLSANGIVALINPNGMVFGRGSQIDVGSLIATTTDIPNERFLTGQHLLFGQPGETNAAIVNQGTVRVDEGGLVALVAPQVTNAGVIEAKMGRVALGAGEIFTVDLYGDGLISLAASDKLREAAVGQTGGIRAEGGKVLLTTAEAKRVMDQTINMDGWVDVGSLTSEAGSIVLHAAQGTADVGGELHADSAVSQGGELQVTGENVKVAAGAVLTAMGATGGGDIKIGGDYLGGGATPHARTTRIASGATIDASATGNGEGGRVIAWSDERTEFGGLIRVKGGLLGGDGGFVETSSKDILVAHGLADASAPYGKGGLWLLDPSNVTIANGAGFNASGGGTVNPATDAYAVDADTIQTALNGGTSVTKKRREASAFMPGRMFTVTTVNAGGTEVGNITVNNATISKTAGGDATLTLKADKDITLTNSTLSATTGELNVTLWSDADNGGAGAITLTNSSITSNGGDITLGGGTDPTTDDAVGTTNYGVDLNNGDISAGAGNISLRGRGEAAGSDNSGVYVHNGSVLQTTTGDITLTGTGGDGTNSNNGIYLTDAGTEVTSVDGDIALTGTGGNGSAGGFNIGILGQINATIASTGTGTITLTGHGHGAGDWNDGLELYDGFAIASVDGDIAITGTSTGTGNNNNGMYLGSAITSTGTADITITGIHADSGTAISVVDGDIAITGTGGDGSAGQNYGVYLESAVSNRFRVF
jgi:filamentous hemagglutinin family protein